MPSEQTFDSRESLLWTIETRKAIEAMTQRDYLLIACAYHEGDLLRIGEIVAKVLERKI